MNHRALFPRVAAVLHHGGAGTTHAAAIAGAPQIVVPMFSDQPHWASRVCALGIGASVPVAELGHGALAAAIRGATAAGVAERARALELDRLARRRGRGAALRRSACVRPTRGARGGASARALDTAARVGRSWPMDTRLRTALSMLLFAAAACDDAATDTSSSSVTSTTGQSSSSAGTGGGASSTSSSGSGSGTGGAGPCTATDGPVLAASLYGFGEGNSGEWKHVGFDLDGLASTGVSTDVCKPNAGAQPATPYPDGDQGIDNSFGKNVLPTVLSLYPTFVTDIDAGIQAGAFTNMMKLECLPPSGDATGILTKLFVGTSLGASPKFDGTDAWPVAPEALSNPANPSSTLLELPNATLSGDVFDTGAGGTVVLRFPFGSGANTTALNLTLHAAHVRAKLSADRKSATGGVIGGVLNTEEFVAEVKKAGALLQICGTNVFGNLLTQIRQSSDILTDGTQDPNKTCDGVSIGITFEAKPVELGPVGPPLGPQQACP
ncbi:MAG: hypothetical protein U0414_42015 [Polyangiaceae bacterium]